MLRHAVSSKIQKKFEISIQSVSLFATQAKLHELLSLHAACHQRMGEIGADLLAQDGVWELLGGDKALYDEVVNAITKRRRTI